MYQGKYEGISYNDGYWKWETDHSPAQRSSSHDGAIILIFLMTSSRSDGGRYQQQIGAGRPGPGYQNISNVLVCRYCGITFVFQLRDQSDGHWVSREFGRFESNQISNSINLKVF